MAHSLGKAGVEGRYSMRQARDVGRTIPSMKFPGWTPFDERNTNVVVCIVDLSRCVNVAWEPPCWVVGRLFLVAESSMQRSGSGPTGAVTTPVDKHTDLTGDQPGIPNEYSGTPVQQGNLQEVTDSKWLQQPVHGRQGEIVGKITQVLKDQKTGEIEYVILERAFDPIRSPEPVEKNDQPKIYERRS
jgi:hypothetical protein